MEKPLEMIKAVNSIKDYVSEDTYNLILKECNLNVEECNKRLKGIKKEAEFILALDMMDCCNNITPIDETFSATLKTYSSDILINLKDGRTIFLEIKCEFEKTTFKISLNNLEKRIKYAKDHSLDLLFAINIKGLWMLFDSDYLLKKNGKITFDDFSNSILYNFFGFNNYLINDFLSIEIYSNRAKNIIGVKDDKYGNLVSQEIKVDNKRVLKIKRKDHKYYMYLFAYEALLERSSVTLESKNGFNIVTRKIDDNQLVNEIELLLSPISHLEKEPGVRYDAESYLKHLSDLRQKCPFNTEYIRTAMKKIGAKPFIIKNKEKE